MHTKERSTAALLAAAVLAGIVLLSAVAGAATAALAPTAITGPVSAVGPSSATVTGTVNPNGQATSWYFEYGTTTGYGSKTATGNAGSGTSNISVSAPLAGLAPGTTYHYRLVATSSAGTSRGADGIFATAAPPAAVTGSATDVRPTSATLNGTVDANGRTTTWYFEYGTSTSYGSKTPVRSAGSGTSSTNVSASLTGLKGATTYHYRLVATNAFGTCVGSDQSFSTSFPPDARTGPAQDVGGTTATLTGSVNPKGRSTTWYFEYGTRPRYGSKTPAQSAGSAGGDHNVATSISGLATGATYHYRLVATTDAGTTAGADMSFTTEAVTIRAGTFEIVYGRRLTLSGEVSNRQAVERVTLLAQSFGESSFSAIATLTTGAGGAWNYAAKPTIRTVYEASWKNATSAAAVGVRPVISFHVITRGRFSTRVVAARSFARRIVQLQRRSGRRWVTVKRVRLDSRSAAILSARLRQGTSTLRVVMSVNQAGAGYLAGISRTIVYHRG